MNGVSDDGIGAIDYLVARSGFLASATVPCTLLTGNTYSQSCAINIASSVPTSSTTPFSVVIKDRAGNPLGDHDLVVTLSGSGSIANPNQTTDSYGEADGFTYTAPALDATVIINVTDNDPRGGVTFSTQITVTAD